MLEPDELVAVLATVGVEVAVVVGSGEIGLMPPESGPVAGTGVVIGAELDALLFADDEWWDFGFAV
ncbi:MAG: hypothetical protein ACRDMJ_10480 [Solirubrobacteraceae bacterium]